ncbi:MAG: ABC transporter permease, partial [Myxococcota bacterium]
MSPRLLVRLLGREIRGARGRLFPFLASLAVGVAAVVLVAGLGDSVSRAIRMEARPLLGADVAARSFQPLPDAVDGVTTAFPGVGRADTIDLLTMVAAPPGPDSAPGKSLMAELKAVSAGWPFYGAPTITPARPLPELLGDDGVVVEGALLERLQLTTGAEVRIGGATFTVRGVVEKEPGRLPNGLSAGPRVLVGLDGLARAGLGESGARVTHRALFHVPDEARAAEV